MTVEEAVRRNPAYSALKSEAEHPTHAYMIVTPDTLTSDLLAKEFIGFMTGRSDAAMMKDVYNLPLGEKVLKDDAEFLCETSYIMPAELDKKYFIVHNAETANETAQNKLLKTLEEPPETAVIILLSANEYSMLPTVRSRCRMIRPTLYDDETLKSVLSYEYPDCGNPSFIAAVSGGSLSKLSEAVVKGTGTFDRALNMLMCMRKSSEILSYAYALINAKEELLPLVDALELILRDCLAIRAKPEFIKLKDNFKDIRELAREYSPDAVLGIMPVLMRARKRINSGGNVNSITDELLFSILEEKAKCQK